MLNIWMYEDWTNLSFIKVASWFANIVDWLQYAASSFFFAHLLKANERYHWPNSHSKDCHIWAHVPAAKLGRNGRNCKENWWNTTRPVSWRSYFVSTYSPWVILFFLFPTKWWSLRFGSAFYHSISFLLCQSLIKKKANIFRWVWSHDFHQNLENALDGYFPGYVTDKSTCPDVKYSYHSKFDYWGCSRNFFKTFGFKNETDSNFFYHVVDYMFSYVNQTILNEAKDLMNQYFNGDFEDLIIAHIR